MGRCLSFFPCFHPTVLAYETCESTVGTNAMTGRTLGEEADYSHHNRTGKDWGTKVAVKALPQRYIFSLASV